MAMIGVTETMIEVTGELHAWKLGWGNLWGPRKEGTICTFPLEAGVTTKWRKVL
jgi:hypothetical protein